MRPARIVRARELDASESLSPSSSLVLGSAVVGNIMALASAVQSWRTVPPSPQQQHQQPLKDVVTCADTLDLFVGLGFQSGGFTVWELGTATTKTLAKEWISETTLSLDTNQLRVLRLVHASKTEIQVVFVDVRRSKSLRFYSSSTAQADREEEERGEEEEQGGGSMMHFSHAIASVAVSPESALGGVVLENHTAQLFDRKTRQVLTVINQAVPLAVSLRWYAHGLHDPVASLPTGQQQQLPSSPPQSIATMTSHMFTTAKQLISPIFQDTIVVRDYKRKDELVCKIKQANGCSFLQFDGSGSMLFCATQDGQTVLVYSLPGGELMHTLERGFSPSTIVSICLSPCRLQLAATTTRGTTHVFPLLSQQQQHLATQPTYSSTRIHSADTAIPVFHVRYLDVTASQPQQQQPILQILSGHNLEERDLGLGGALVRTWDLSREMGEGVLGLDTSPVAAAASAATTAVAGPTKAPATARFTTQPFVPSELPVWRSSEFAR
ncbi:hypothetical protein BASA81_007802 [Batrachochytrium salamandrivorans]|nr:hypothetical protein BASA81_007802 [Batrachochytrium salamandrivorans]